MSVTWIFVDGVLEQIEMEIVGRAPERGGALLGPVGYPVVSHFVLDVDARTTSALYVPSSSISSIVAHMEAAGTLELKGVLHSHPGLDRLSRQDEATFSELLDLNPHLARCLAPIATQLRPSRPHDIPTPSGKLSCFCITRGRKGAVVDAADSTTLPVLSLAREVADLLGAGSVDLIGPSHAFGPMTVDALLLLNDGRTIVLALPLSFPLSPPTVLLTDAEGAARLVPLRWDPSRPAAAQVVATFDVSRSLRRRRRTLRRNRANH